MSEPIAGWYRFVCHADIPAFEAAGWEPVADLGCTHGHWSILCQWCGDGEAP
jgi:invasion protein IalB